MIDFLLRFFSKQTGLASKHVAKERLRLVLVHDRTDVSPQLIQSLKEDLIKVISEYMELDENSLEVFLKSTDNSVALVANFPVKRVKRTLPARVDKVG